MKRGPLSHIEELLFDISLAWAWTVIIALSVFAIGLACFGQGNYLPPEPAPTDKNAKPTIAMREYASRFQWQRSAYYRTEDTMIDLPVFLVLAGDGTACIIDGQEWALWREHKVVACPGKWRFPR